ncbi:MAG: hypothetical protein COA58_10215 [Bacteroidetes bacterium]|nr:MAG: hypothetical protein COA58_10215 [Bacteroidota bacterium]
MILRSLGDITYWKKIIADDTVEFKINHTFQKQSSLSQFEIVNTNGRQKLSIPTVKKTRKGKYELVQIDYSTNWQIEHWRSIENAYLKSPFYLYYGYKIEAIFKQNHITLLDLNCALVEIICNCIKLKKEPIFNRNEEVYFEKQVGLSHSIYPQVFDTKLPFEQNLCILDLLFNLGPETLDYLRRNH